MITIFYYKKDEEGADETSVTHATNTAVVAENEKTLPFKKRTVYNGMKKVEKVREVSKKKFFFSGPAIKALPSPFFRAAKKVIFS